MLNRTRITIFFLLALGAGTAWSADPQDLSERNAQLEATVEELTLQLADSLAERRALEEEVARLQAELEAATQAATAAAAAATVTGPTASSAPEGPVVEAAAPAPDREADEGVVEEEILAAGAPAVAETPGATAQSTMDNEAGADAADASSEACDVEDALRGYKRSGKANRALGEWLQAADHLKVCSTEQLMTIRKAVKFDFLGYEKAVLAMIDEELAAR